MSQNSIIKPINPAMADRATANATDILQRLALASLVHQNGGRIVFPLSDLDWIKDHTLGLTSEVISSQHTQERWFVVKVAEEPKESRIVQ